MIAVTMSVGVGTNVLVCDMSSDVAVGLSMGALMVDVLSRIVIEVLTDVNAKTFAVVMTAWWFPLSTRLEEVCCC